ncbi:MAG: hypothetical protein WC378_00190 [Opitutaceae bacterium]
MTTLSRHAPRGIDTRTKVVSSVAYKVIRRFEKVKVIPERKGFSGSLDAERDAIRSDPVRQSSIGMLTPDFLGHTNG